MPIFSDIVPCSGSPILSYLFSIITFHSNALASVLNTMSDLIASLIYHHISYDILSETTSYNVTLLADNWFYTERLPAQHTTGDNHTQNYHLERYIIRYVLGNPVSWLC